MALQVDDYIAHTNPWLWKPRPVINGVPGSPPRIIEIHSTRGGANTYWKDYGGCISWARSPNNKHVTAWGEAWGSSFTYVIHMSSIARILSDFVMPTYSAGYGGPGTWPVDAYAISIELAQPRFSDPFPPKTLETAAELCAHLCTRYSINPERIWLPDQTVWPPPSGIVGHEDTANGHILGKSDPGPMFPWSPFIADIQRRLQKPEEGEEMPILIKRVGDSKVYVVAFTHLGPRKSRVPNAVTAKALGLDLDKTRTVPDDVFHGILDADNPRGWD